MQPKVGPKDNYVPPHPPHMILTCAQSSEKINLNTERSLKLMDLTCLTLSKFDSSPILPSRCSLRGLGAAWAFASSAALTPAQTVAGKASTLQ